MTTFMFPVLIATMRTLSRHCSSTVEAGSNPGKTAIARLNAMTNVYHAVAQAVEAGVAIAMPDTQLLTGVLSNIQSIWTNVEPMVTTIKAVEQQVNR